FFFFQAEDGIRDFHVTGVQTCALPIFDEVVDGLIDLAADEEMTFGPSRDDADIDDDDEEAVAALNNAKLEELKQAALARFDQIRSEERRVGKERRYSWRRET